MINLRAWQAKCINHALASYQSGQKHFLCLATPGAGKSVMSASLAHKLLEMQMIDFVVCFSPSKAIALGLTSTFEKVLNCRFDGRMGAQGHSLTYQSMNSLDEQFWQLFNDYRVFVVLDEVHHCAGDTYERANAWGQVILRNVQKLATYTLALTGTPWRTDAIPVCLATYSRNDKIICDYVYGIQEAINDGVCRLPNLTLFDNDQLVCRQSTPQTYKGIKNYLDSPESAYSYLLNNADVIHHIFQAASAKLSQLQRKYANAAGLIVAESVKHARRICDILTSTYGQTPVLVTHHDPDAQQVINTFRTSKQNWIVSVGMISEGTDIPRLRVCCHLSNVKTELYFRQILGRIIRNTDTHKAKAWLYTLAHPLLVEYAQRLKEEIPETKITLSGSTVLTGNVKADALPITDNRNSKLIDDISFGKWNENTALEKPDFTHLVHTSADDYFKIVGNYRAMLVRPFG
ncbi:MULTISPECIES: DEAD/DEAH box helicase [Vibrio]|uniref:DEAD/DEAH box helicase n=1 Tax=Vibrio TaxID=662 RepID=UPI000317B91B|nr:DEAD/DEAH box helicase family protein [Vibrio crassostreae]OEE89408.1 DEAD/DEAH box helicase [Vibrio crassostreae 9ZC88]